MLAPVRAGYSATLSDSGASVQRKHPRGLRVDGWCRCWTFGELYTWIPLVQVRASKSGLLDMGYRRFHWSLFNVLARFMGLMFGLGSLECFIDVARALIYREPREGIPSDPVTAAYVSLFVAIATGAIAVALLGSGSYRPDLGDPMWSGGRSRTNAGEQPRSRRSWWTGEPRADT
jgi:hypothetical protein